jgi:hypothetical protein
MGAVKNFEQVIAGQAAKLAAFARSGYQLDASVAGTTLGTGDIGFSHGRKVSPPRELSPRPLNFRAADHKLFTGLLK